MILCLAAIVMIAGCAKEKTAKDIAACYTGKGIDTTVSVRVTHKGTLNDYIMTQSSRMKTAILSYSSRPYSRASRPISRLTGR